jgi:hypothetical protein
MAREAADAVQPWPGKLGYSRHATCSACGSVVIRVTRRRDGSHGLWCRSCGSWRGLRYQGDARRDREGWIERERTRN